MDRPDVAFNSYFLLFTYFLLNATSVRSGYCLSLSFFYFHKSFINFRSSTISAPPHK